MSEERKREREYNYVPVSPEDTRTYRVADVIDVVKAGNLPAVADAAKLYPSLVAAVMASPIDTLRALYGARRAYSAEKKLRRLLFYERVQEVPELRAITTRAESDVPQVTEAVRPATAAEDEAQRLLRLIREAEAEEADDDDD